MDTILRTHSIEPATLRSDDFDGFFQRCKATLLALVERAMGKQAIGSNDLAIEDAPQSGEDEIAYDEVGA